MNIVVMGAGAIGSLFGGLLSKKNTVVLVGRKSHIEAIQQHGLQITGKTQATMNLTAVTSPEEVTLAPDLLILTVKSYDTETAIRHAVPLIHEKTMVLSLQNGLDNIEKIETMVNKNHILAGVTTHGAIFSNPGRIIHTGVGTTILGELNGESSPRLASLIRIFNEAGIKTDASTEIQKEIWIKTIINSSINPLTTFFGCKNGYLLKNLVLERIVERICDESTRVAQGEGYILTTTDMIQRTKKVITETAENYSSMLQSAQQGKKTEIDAINGRLVLLGKKQGISTPLNEILCILITSLCAVVPNTST
jgi:2-dehydropantoate 2-reductase